MGQLQLMSGSRYRATAAAQALHTVPLSAERGSIFDRSGRDLALSIERETVYADPTLVADPVSEAAKLAPVLHVSERYLRAQLSDRPHRFEYLARAVDDNAAAAARALNLPGIGFVPESARTYPAGSLAGAIIGRVGTDGNGLDGVEYLYDKILAGSPGELVLEQDPEGHDIPGTERTRVDAQRGTDVELTIDQDLQWQTESSLLDQVVAQGAKGGMAVVVDVQTGDVLAMASVHGADHTRPAGLAGPDDRNTPLTDLFEPGSTNKLITISWALEHGNVAPDTMFDVPYAIRLDAHDKPYRDAEWHPREAWTTGDILRESSNVGTIEIAQRMTNREMADGLRAFGLGKPTSVAWPYQPAGLLIDPSQYYATGKYSTSIGYGVAVTGMQMLDAFATIANGGMTRPPHLLDATIDARGRRHVATVPASTRVVSANTASIMTNMLEGVVDTGTGVCASVRGYKVAGKTGTAKKLLASGYSDRSTMASFIGFAPADHPRFAALVALDEPSDNFASVTAAPVWSEIMQAALIQYGVPPSDAKDTQYKRAHATAQAKGLNCAVPHGS
ncbi:MAG TPA: penicillin-binding protein 2, partial [Acidimicrobiia bacterium]|nr:penicillin-binding protein 2 [Acidimicrobiia bacterium]